MAFGDLKGSALTGAANSITNPISATGSVAVAIGDLIVGVIGEQTNLTATACGDNLHGASTYSAVNAGTDGGTITGRCFYKVVTTSGTLTSVDFVATASADNVSVVAAVFEGPFKSSPLDKAPANNNNTDNSSPFTCPATGTLTQADELVICWMTGQSNATWSATSPLLKAGQQTSQSVADTILGYKTVSSTTTTSPEFTGTNPSASVQGTATFMKDLNQTLTPGLFTNSNSFKVPVTKFTTHPGLLSNTNSFFTPKTGFVTHPTLFTNTSTFKTPVVTPGAVSLVATLYTNTNTFFTPVIAGSAVDLTPGLFTNSNTFFTPTTKFGTTAGLLTNSNTFFSATIASGAVDLTPGLLSNTNTFQTPVVTSTVNLTATLFTNSNTFAAVTLDPGAVDLTPGLLSNTNTFQTPVLTSSVNLTASLFTNTNTFQVATIATSGQSLNPTLFTNSGSFFTPVIESTTQELVVSLFANTSEFISSGFFPGIFTPGSTDGLYLYAPDGSWRVTIVDGLTYSGRMAPDESMYIVPSSVTPDDVEGMDHPCGALIFTTAPDNTVVSRQAENGSLYVQVYPYTSTGAQRVTVVTPFIPPSSPPPTQIIAPAKIINVSQFGNIVSSIISPDSPILVPKLTNTNSFIVPTFVGTPPSNAYTADAVHFDGITRLHRTSFSSTDPQNFFTFSCWFKIEPGTPGALTLWNADPSTNEDAYCQFLNSSDNLYIYYKDDSTVKKTPRMSATVGTNFADGNWHHVLAAMDASGHPLSASKRIVYIDDVLQSPSLVTNGPGPFNILVNGRPFFVGDDNQGNFFVGDMADFWWDNHTYYVSGSDLPVSFRRKFIDGGGKPVDPVNFPTGNILFSGDHTNFSTNQGTGGTFTVISGALTDASTSPSD